VPTVENQPVAARLSRSAIFIIATLNGDGDSLRAVRSLCGDLAALVRAVGFRDLNGGLSCVMGFGSEAWDRLFGAPPLKSVFPDLFATLAVPKSKSWSLRPIVMAARRRRRGSS
jgi:porphyrinogen peroxidase